MTAHGDQVRCHFGLGPQLREIDGERAMALAVAARTGARLPWLDAVSRRGLGGWPTAAQGRHHHSDQGSQYTSVAFGKRCGEAGVRPSMGSVGDAYDNAMTESFFSTLEAELLSRRRFASQAEAKMACFSYIEGWYNPVRLHSGLGYRSPLTCEADMQATMTTT